MDDDLPRAIVKRMVRPSTARELCTNMLDTFVVLTLQRDEREWSKVYVAVCSGRYPLRGSFVKSKLAEIAGDIKRDVAINKDALNAFSECAKIFIHYLTATANDICQESRQRSTVTADDVLKALEELDFHELCGPLSQSLEGKSSLPLLVTIHGCCFEFIQLGSPATPCA
eukprot:scaffold999_cov375-Prasinococcus_capsulatus_cf.AAC.6